MSHPVPKLASVLTLVVGPDVSAFAIPHVVLEHALEGALIVVVDDSPLAVQPPIFVPSALVRTASDLDRALTHELPLARLVVRRCRPVTHRQQFASCKCIVCPDSLDLRDVTFLERHLALPMQLVLLNLTIVRDA